MRVLHVIPGDGKGNSFIFARRQIEFLEQLGIATEIFYLTSRNNPIILIKEAFRFKKLLKASKPDVVHAQFGSITALFTTILCNVPVVITFRGSDLNPSPPYWGAPNFLRRFFSQLSIIRASHAICVSEQLKSRIFSRWKGKISVKPTGVDTLRFKPIDQALARQNLGWKTDDKIILFNGKSNPVKRFDLAEQAFQIAQKDCNKLKMFILDNDISPELIPMIINASDCLLVTSDFEGSPTIVQEAAACNLPVVTVEVGDVKEILAQIAPSFIVERKPEMLAAAINSIINSGLRSNGSNFIYRFSNESVAKSLIKTYSSITGGNYD